MCAGNIVSMSDRVAKLRYCVAHFERLPRQGTSTEMAKVYLAAKVRSSPDSPLEEGGFELPVPP